MQIWYLSDVTIMGALSSRGFKTRDVAMSLLIKLVKVMMSINLWTEHNPPVE